jgi:hypothetical protein
MKRREAIEAVEAAVKAAQEAGVTHTELMEAVGWGAFQGGSIDVKDEIEQQLDLAEHECPDPCPDEKAHDRVEELEAERKALRDTLQELIEGVEESLDDLKRKVEAIQEEDATV